MRAAGIDFAPGFTQSDIAAIGDVWGTAVPDELSLFLRAGVPVSPQWARWVEGPAVAAADTKEWMERAFAFDIEQSQYWHPHLGDRPQELHVAIDKALAFIAEAPPLLPIFGHRYLTTAPVDGPRAVLSVWQAVDSIFYGNDLADYFATEFSISRPAWATAKAPPVPVWGDLFNLFGTWDE